MLGPVPALVAARLRRRGATTALSVAAIAVAVGLVAIVSGIGLVAADATLARAMAGTGADRPVVRISSFSPSATDLDASNSAASASLVHLEPYTGNPVRGVILMELRDLRASLVDLVIAVDDPEQWLQLTDGRAPARCLDGNRCEAVLLATDLPDVGFSTAQPAPGVELAIVGHGQLDAVVPFGDIDQRGPFGSDPRGGDYQTGRERPAVLLVNGVDAIARSPALAGTGRTYVWTAPIDPGAIHPWTATAATRRWRRRAPR